MILASKPDIIHPPFYSITSVPFFQTFSGSEYMTEISAAGSPFTNTRSAARPFLTSPTRWDMNVYLLEGKVECTAGGTATVSAGEVGRLDETAGTVTVEPFAQDAIPDFVRGELDGISLDGIPETAEPAADPEPDPIADALAQYRVVAAQASAYDYGADDPTGDYRYALARMRADSNIPALLLEQDTTFGISNVLVFQYEPDNGQAVQSDGTMSEGVAQAGG